MMELAADGIPVDLPVQEDETSTEIKDFNNETAGALNANISGVAGGEDPLTFPSVLHFLHREWRRFERERNIWELEKAEMKTRIQVLEGEKRGSDVLKSDLLRRIKMLEYALKQERAKVQALPVSMNVDPDKTAVIGDITTKSNDLKTSRASDSNYDVSSLRRSYTTGKKAGSSKTRDIIKQYLQEIGYSESTVSPVEPEMAKPPVKTEPAVRPKSILVSSSNSSEKSSANNTPRLLSKEAQERRQQVTKSIIYAPEDLEKLKNPENWEKLSNPSKDSAWDSLFVPAETETSKNGSLDNDLASLKIQEEEYISGDDAKEKTEKQFWTNKFTLRNHMDSVTSVAFHSNDLCLLTASEDGCVKYWNLENLVNAKRIPADIEPVKTYRGHRGTVNAVLLSSITPPSLDSVHQEMLQHGMGISAGCDGTIRIWALPEQNHQPYSKYEYSRDALTDIHGHQDAIWDIRLHSIRPILCSAGADGLINIWDLNSLDDSYFANKDAHKLRKCAFSFNGLNPQLQCVDVVPTSIDFLASNSNQFVSSFSNSQAKIFDFEEGKEVVQLKGADSSYDGTTSTQINKIIAHKSMNMLITAHEDKFIRFFDTRDGTCIHSMVAHLDSVSALDISPNGLVLCSGGHDCSTRLWDISTRTCLQEFTVHRKKFDESIKCVAFHPRTVVSKQKQTGTDVFGSSGWLCTAGADSIVKIHGYP